MNYITRIINDVILFLIMVVGVIISALFMIHFGQLQATPAAAIWLSSALIIGFLSIMLSIEIYGEIRDEREYRKGLSRMRLEESWSQFDDNIANSIR